jgi:hypothetical protein
MTCPVSPTCLFARLHAPRIVWPAFTPQCKPALALALAPAPARPARPRLGAGCVPPVCADHRTGRPRACLPRLPDSLQPFPPVSPERGGAFGSSPTANRLSTCRWYACLVRLSITGVFATRTRNPARGGATVGRCLPAVRACRVWGLGVHHRRRSSNDCPPFSLEIWGCPRTPVFFQVPRTPCL